MSAALCEAEVTAFAAEKKESKDTLLATFLGKETVGDAMKSINDADQDSRDCWHAREDAGNCRALLLRRRD